MLGLVLAPLLFGATLPWTRSLLQILAAFVGVCWLLSPHPSTPLLILPLLAAGLGLGQVLPLPSTLLFRLSSLAQRAHAALQPLGIRRTPSCLSMDPGATLAAARQLLLMLTVLAAIADLARGPASAKALARTLAAVGLIVLLLGLAFSPARQYTVLGFHDMTGPIRPWKNPLIAPLHSNGTAYLDSVRVGPVRCVVRSPVVGDVFGPYVNSNHFAGCLELTIPLALALLIGRAARSRRRKTVLYALAALLALVTLLTVAVGAHARAGTLALLFAAAVAAVALLPRRTPRIALGFALAPALVAFVMFTAVLAFRPPVPDDHPAKPSPIRTTAQHRVTAWRAAGQMFKRAPLAGAGLGTYGELHPAFAKTQPVLYFAHNDYLQFLAEAGILGLALVACALWLLYRHARITPPDDSPPPFPNPQSPIANRRPLRIALLSALAALALHSAFDYNLHVPANAFIFAVLLGLLLAGPGTHRRPPPAPEPSARTTRLLPNRIARTLLFVILLGVAVAAARDLAADRAAMKLRHALVAQRSPETPLTDSEKLDLLRHALPAAQRAARLAPLDAELPQLIARAHLHLSRGRPSPELEHARHWLARTLARRPLDTPARNTFRQITNAGTGKEPMVSLP